MTFRYKRSLLLSLIAFSAGCDSRSDHAVNEPPHPRMTESADTDNAPEIDFAFAATNSIELISPDQNTPLSTRTATVAWKQVPGATSYYLGVGKTPEAVARSPWGDLFSKNVGLATSVEVSHLPLDGSDLRIRIWANVGGVWTFADYTLQTVGVPLQKARLTTPAAGSEITGGPLTLTWSEGSGASTFFLGVGTSLDSVRSSPWGDIFHGDVRKNTAYTIEQIPAGATTIYIRLWSYLKDHWEYEDYAFPVLKQPSLQLSPATVVDQAAAVAQSRFRFYRFPNGDYLNWGGLSEKWLRSHHEPGQQFFITPEGTVFRWDGSPKAGFPGQSVLVAAISPHFYDDLDALTGIELPSDPAAVQSAFGFSAPYGSYQFNWGGKAEKWIRADLAGGAWFYLLPDGSLYRWDRSARANFPGLSTLVARLPAIIYENPALLIKAPDAAGSGSKIISVTTQGSGCPPGSTAVNIAPDLKALTVLFDSFYVSYDPEQGEEITLADCQVGVDLHIPSGWQVSMISLDIRGFADLPEQTALQVEGAVSFNGYDDRIVFQEDIAGPASADFHLRGEATSKTLNWSRCGGPQRLTMEIAAKLSPGQNAPAYAAIDGIDGEITNKMGLVWRQCGQ